MDDKEDEDERKRRTMMIHETNPHAAPISMYKCID